MSDPDSKSKCYFYEQSQDLKILKNKGRIRSGIQIRIYYFNDEHEDSDQNLDL
jgi:hypothetical protein